MSVPDAWPHRSLASLPGRLAARVARGLRAGRLRRRRAAGPRALFVVPGVLVTGARNVTLGEGVRLLSNCHLWATERGRLTIGPRPYIGSHSWLVANESITVGADVLIAPFCYVQDTDHGFADPAVAIALQPSVSSAIVIEDNVWLGAHTVVTRGVRIGRGSVIGAGSVVTHDIPPYTVAVGAPARPIRSRDQ